ncbi:MULTISPECIES: nucleotide exchange factor GrpE [Fischerella]|uniref:Nucleotide exchange factor GrpE n=1 Tax=Fischerella muscicola CCMEE 5323 TaxID=2019572 RepID=A0A2N6K4E2_FISMU|nr:MULTISPECIES: nucleotide exchange factor GrpE [Fischerella]MBD2434367.1 nucleotide exchange factor GrpE [Fischerella sp. FACHB-380]PLZ90691.1 nucleotide exchange factor GrpE [Fischerella muscicola CCMEE 5323]
MSFLKKGGNNDLTGDNQVPGDNINVVLESLNIINKNIIELYNLLNKKVNSYQKDEDVKREVEEFKKSIQEEILKELNKSIKNGHYQNNIIVQENTSSAKELKESLLETRGFMEETLNSQIQEMKIQLKEIMDQRQELGNLRRKIEGWQDFAVDFLKYMERTLELLPNSNSENEQYSQQLISKVLKDFEKHVYLNFGLERISPSPGDDLDENLHQAVEEKESTEVQPGKILDCKEWGYRINGELYQDKRAKVILAKPPEQKEVVGN